MQNVVRRVSHFSVVSGFLDMKYQPQETQKDEFSNMADGRHIRFVNSAIRAMMINKHCCCYNLDYLVLLAKIHLTMTFKGFR